jgi:hypothetical protein
MNGRLKWRWLEAPPSLGALCRPPPPIPTCEEEPKRLYLSEHSALHLNNNYLYHEGLGAEY